MDRPQWSALASQIADLRRVTGTIEEKQRRMLRVTGAASSPDRLVKATVGPRGQLVELEIDPRVYRTPDAKALAATILATVREATEQAMTRTREILDEELPNEMRLAQSSLGWASQRHDGELLQEGDSAELR
jgi:DNA-binding protein YbaB